MGEMSKDEFFAFMPLLIYGIAIGEIIMHWRDYLKKDRRYWPHIITGIILLDMAFLNFYYLYDELNLLFETYPKFLGRMTTPIIFLLIVSVFTPEDDDDLKDYFLSKMKMIFSLLALFITVHIVLNFEFNFINILRSIAIINFLVIAYTRKFNLIWIYVSIRVFVFFFNTYFQNLFQ